ncbi:MAG: DUF167 domain-containing protein [Pseudomonadota bacterium]
MTYWYRRDAETTLLTLHVQPGAKRNEIVGLHGDALKVRLAAPPVDGQANEMLLKFISECMRIGRRQVSIKYGEQSRRKVVVVEGGGTQLEDLLKLKQSG